jgi:hypothetical protein
LQTNTRDNLEEIYSTDIVGNTGVSQIVYFTISTPISTQHPFSFGFWIAVTAILIGVAISLLAYLKRFRKSK